MTSFDERQKSFEKKFVMDAELQFKVSAKRNRYLAEWVAIKMGKNDEEKENYIKEVIKADFIEPGDEDVFKKIKFDFERASIPMQDSEIRNQMKITLDRAKKDFI
mgnify:FL=1|tara:strand:+ start:219 stop:533 length:315 start_codon:yes stop_codon:yes gene_type:complete